MTLKTPLPWTVTGLPVARLHDVHDLLTLALDATEGSAPQLWQMPSVAGLHAQRLASDRPSFAESGAGAINTQPNPDSGTALSRFVGYIDDVQIQFLALLTLLEAAKDLADSQGARVSAAALDLLPMAVQIAREVTDALDSVRTSKVLA